MADLPDPALERLRARLAEIAAVMVASAETPNLSDLGLIGEFTPQPMSARTRSGLTGPAIDIVHINSPDGLDPQVNIAATATSFSIEVAAEPGYPELWAIATWEGMVLSGRFESSPQDASIRIARLPRPAQAQLTVQIRVVLERGGEIAEERPPL